MKKCPIVLVLLFLINPIHAQVITKVYDGVIGIERLFENDTLYITGVARNLPAEKYGIRKNDIVLEIDSTKTTGAGLGLSEIDALFNGSAGQPIQFKIQRPGIDSLISITLLRDLSLNIEPRCEYEYLVDSTGGWTIEDIISDSIQQLFSDPSEKKIMVHSIKEGSNGEKLGLKPGDRLISLRNDMLLWSTIDDDQFNTQDTILVILRDSAEIIKNADDKTFRNLGITSQFGHDLINSCIWLKITTRNLITEDRAYLLELWQYYDSVLFYQQDRAGSFSVRKTGILVPADERDYLLKDKMAIQVVLRKNQEQTFFVNIFKNEDNFPPMLELSAVDHIIKYDRYERILSGILWGIMLIVALYYLILYLFMRESSYLYYAIFILSFGLFFLWDAGYAAELIWPDSIAYYLKLDTFFTALPFLFYILFGIHYLSLKENLRIWYKIAIIDLLILIVSMTVFSVFDLFGFDLLYDFITVVFVVFFISIFIAAGVFLVTSILRIRKKFRPAWYFLTATVLMIAFFAIYGFLQPDLFSSDLEAALSNSLLYFGVIPQFLVLSIGLGQKIRNMERARQLAQKRIIEQLRENEKLKDKVNRELEQKVQERTQEIQMQKEEIETQRDELEKQRDVVTHQKQELTDSIMYASRIQTAVLPPEELLEDLLPEHFVLFKPRDLVSGDFYWIRQIKHFTVVVAADCTGHGVPGAFMSMLGISFLNEMVSRSRFDTAGEFLDRLRKKVKSTLKQEGKKFEQKDGMDMSLAIIDNETLDLQYAGAFNPLIIIRNKELELDNYLSERITITSDNYNLIEIKGDHQPIAIHEKETDFQTHHLKLEKGDSLYIFSDGYPDQMGGPKGKKFMIKKFKHLLLDIQPESLKKQKQILDQTLQNWRGDVEQIDDILVFGIRWH